MLMLRRTDVLAVRQRPAACSRRVVIAAARQQHAPAASSSLSGPQQPSSGFHAALLAGLVLCTSAAPAWADSPADCDGPECALLPFAASSPFAGATDAQRKKLEDMDAGFKNSGTLKALLEKSEANKAKNKREIQDKYCYRQAELGVGDCGGLRLIPGMTKNGKQKTPKWLEQALGVEQPEMEGDGLTLSDLLGPNADK